MTLARVDELTAKRALFTVGIEQGMVEHESLAARISKLKVASATCDGEFCVAGPAMQLLECVVAVVENRANFAGASGWQHF